MRYITRDRDFYKSFFRLTSVIALQNIIVYAVNLADNIMLGSYGESAMSGVALVNQIQFLLQMVIVGVGEGVNSGFFRVVRDGGAQCSFGWRY